MPRMAPLNKTKTKTSKPMGSKGDRGPAKLPESKVTQSKVAPPIKQLAAHGNPKPMEANKSAAPAAKSKGKPPAGGSREEASTSSTGPSNWLAKLITPSMGPRGFTTGQKMAIHKRQIARAASLH